MRESKKSFAPIDLHLGCFGEYNSGDTICRKFCALRLRCAIEQDQNARLELIEDLISYEDVNIKLQ